MRHVSAPLSASRSLAPKEHGAYGQLFLPLAAALAMAKPTPAAMALTAAGGLAFFAHEPLLIMLGHRGPKAKREDGARAKKRLVALGGAAAVAGAAGALLAPSLARASLIVPVALASIVMLFIVRRAEKTLTGEVVAATALASAALPVALASGVRPAIAMGALVAWSAAFSASTFAVRAVIAHAREAVPFALRIAGPIIVLITSVAAGRADLVPLSAALAALPMVLFALAIAVTTPPPKALPRVGWSLVGSSVLTTAFLIVIAHA